MTHSEHKRTVAAVAGVCRRGVSWRGQPPGVDARGLTRSSLDRGGVAAFGGEQHPGRVEIGEQADVVLLPASRGLIHPHPPHRREVLTGPGSTHMMLHHPPYPGVVLTHRRGDPGHRHRLGEGQHQRLEQHREPRPRPRPRQGHQPHPVLAAAHPRHPRVQKRLVLKEIQMPPRLVHRVMHPDTAAARNRTPGTQTAHPAGTRHAGPAAPPTRRTPRPSPATARPNPAPW